MSLPDLPEIFERKSFRDYVRNVKDFRDLLNHIERYMRYKLDYQRQLDIAKNASILGIQNLVINKKGLKVFYWVGKSKKGVWRDAKGRYAYAPF
jgi:hypothetical protein